MTQPKKKQREYKTYLKEGKLDLTMVWGEVIKRIRQGGEHERRYKR